MIQARMLTGAGSPGDDPAGAVRCWLTAPGDTALTTPGAVEFRASACRAGEVATIRLDWPRFGDLASHAPSGRCLGVVSLSVGDR